MKKYNYFLLLGFFINILIFEVHAETFQKHMLVIIPSYNNQNYAQWNISTVLQQNYQNFSVFYINDCSTDNTEQIIRNEVAGKGFQDKVTIISNHERKGALYNIYQTIYNYAKEEDIIVLLDGDDGFANDNVLRYLNKVYTSPDVWLTYGQFKELNSGNIGFCSPIPTHIIDNNDYRSWHHIPSHLRTFYAWLFKKIRVEDLMYGGEFFKMTWDMAIMLPMIEMTGGRFRFIPKVLYAYNDRNPISDHRIDKNLQRALDLYIRANPKYKPLECVPHCLKADKY